MRLQLRAQAREAWSAEPRGVGLELEYTIYGDTVSTAARIEELTKRVERSVVLADATGDALAHPPDDLQPLGEFEIRGRRSTTALWAVGSLG